MRRILLFTLALLCGHASGVPAHEIDLKDLKIVHPYTKEPPPGVADVPVYMTIRNHGTDPDRIVAVELPMCRKAEFRAGPPAADKPTPAIEIPSGGSIKLTKSTEHVMLLGLTEPLTGYETFPLWLTFEKAGRIEVEVMVEEADDGMTGGGTPDTPQASPPASPDASQADHAHHGDHK